MPGTGNRGGPPVAVAIHPPLFFVSTAAEFWQNQGVMIYQPDPIDVSQVSLTPELQQLTERLAENTHDLWAVQRLADGWTFGDQRDDVKKQHPCLIPYDKLPENEREYDRIAVLGTLKAILKLGYQLSPPATSKK